LESTGRINEDCKMVKVDSKVLREHLEFFDFEELNKAEMLDERDSYFYEYMNHQNLNEDKTL
jgi:hypothetical protein